jgi:outer membrane protein assembly factor BamB
MDRKFTLPFALALVAAALVGCSTNKLKVEEPKPNPLKISTGQNTGSVFSQSVSSTDKADPLRLQLDSDNGVNFIVDPKGEVAAYRGKQRLWETCE